MQVNLIELETSCRQILNLTSSFSLYEWIFMYDRPADETRTICVARGLIL